eukprot:CAMPEP_0204216706 /NCGR_PEP_ID=MMETSP0361-20130328/78388_1 /ASSEMBLY_ACC=CAM_ASM_000343 /TAXON_ID=268821 /ORGANISM="Scrippsiella Hangoei, Strain SHTV-5" /LENGTH=75 /DNA_ID=CAMNT_0051181615 /DNA_START=36 /DNA_END=259 /DNA_ORIENTATION=-
MTITHTVSPANRSACSDSQLMRGAQSKIGRRRLTILAKTAACFEHFRPMQGPGSPEEVSEDPSSEEEAPVPDASS